MSTLIALPNAITIWSVSQQECHALVCPIVSYFRFQFPKRSCCFKRHRNLYKVGHKPFFFLIMGYKSLGVWLAAHSPQSSFSNLSQSLDITASSSWCYGSLSCFSHYHEQKTLKTASVVLSKRKSFSGIQKYRTNKLTVQFTEGWLAMRHFIERDWWCKPAAQLFKNTELGCCISVMSMIFYFTALELQQVL